MTLPTETSPVEVVAMVVSICALLLTLYNARLSREHYRISISPRLSSYVRHWTSSEGDNTIVHYDVGLTNTGLGPASISTFEMLVDDEPVPNDGVDETFSSIKSALPVDYVDSQCSIGILRKRYVMAAGERHSVVVLAIRNPSKDLDEKLKRFQLRVKFSSMYGETAVYDTRIHL